MSDLSLENLMDVRVTTASKKSQTLSESPAAVFVVDSADIHRFGYRTLADALRSIVGIYVSSDRSFDYIGVRGYSCFGDFNGRVLLLIDGHRVNDPIFDAAPIGQDCPVDMEDVDRIEVVKGPGSSLWGTNALLATVNIITRTGLDAGSVRLAADGEKYQAQYADSFSSGLNVVFSATGLRSDGEKRIYFPEFDSPETNNGVAENADGLRASRGRFAASYGGLKFSYIQGRRKKVLPTASFGTIFNDPGTFIDESRTQTELSYERSGGPSGRHGLFARVFSDGYSYLGDYAYDYPPRVINRDNDDARWWGGEIRLSDAISSNLSLTYGADYQRAGRLVMSNYDVDPYQDYYLMSTTETTRSVYAQATYQPSSTVDITVGTRRDKYSSFGNTWSPRAALVYSPSADMSIKALYGSAFRAPNSYELSWGDPSLPPTQPEKMRTQELVWEKRVGSDSRLVASLFGLQINDIITDVESDSGRYIANHGSARTSGFELQYETRSRRGMIGHVGFCRTRASASDGLVSNSPNFLFDAGVSMPILSHRYFLSPQIHTTGRVLTKSGSAIESETIVDLVVTTAIRDKGTDVSLGVYNLLGTTVFAPALTTMSQDKVPQAGRTLHLTVSREF